MRVLDLLLPPRCAACDAAGGWPLCSACTESVVVVTQPWCARCGRPLKEPQPSCADCPPPQLDTARAPFLYEGPVASAIKAMKFAGVHGLAVHLASAMARVLGSVEADEITWVPLSRRRRSRRGFDQAEVLARALARRLELPVGRSLVRARDSSSQARRSGADRRAALRGAFRLTGRPPRPRVLLVDDVLTTGSTAAECAETLKSRGVEEVTLVTAARSLGGMRPSGGGSWPTRAEYHRFGLAPGSVVARGKLPR